jgi:hypothetical protein
MIRLSLMAAAALFAAGSVLASDAPAKRSLAGDYGYMIGAWTCHVTQAGQTDQQTHVVFAWAFDGRLLRETVTGADGKPVGEFLTSYDPRSGSFKGVGVGNWGGYVVWENKGLAGNHSSETGYLFADGMMVPISRSEFEKVSETHYVFRDFDVDASGAKTTPTDTEDCLKQT